MRISTSTLYLRFESRLKQNTFWFSALSSEKADCIKCGQFDRQIFALKVLSISGMQSGAR